MENAKRCTIDDSILWSENQKKKIKLNSVDEQNTNWELTDEEDIFNDSDILQFINSDNKENQVQNLNEQKNWYRLDITNWQRCIVVDIERDKRNDLILRLRAEKCPEKLATCRLQGPWCYTNVECQSLVTISGTWDAQLNCYLVNMSTGYIIINPDYLISGTSVVGSLFCRRKGVLQNKFRKLHPANKALTIGSIIHELLQVVLMKNLTSASLIEEAAKMLLESREMGFMLYTSKIGINEISKEVYSFLPSIIEFVEQYILEKNDQESADVFKGVIENIQDIEENLWIPNLGLKGKIDVSLKVKKKIGCGYQKSELVPLEVKTGASSFSSEHKGQVILYQMMLSQIEKTSDCGLLLYLPSGDLKEIPATRNEKRDLIILRNDLSYYLVKNLKTKKVENLSKELSSLLIKFESCDLPEPINHRACSNCAYNTICCSYLKTNEVSLPENHNLQNVLSESTDHLNEHDLAYFINWCGILELENQETNKFNSNKGIWTETPEERTKCGRAIAFLKICGKVELKDEGKFLHIFKLDENSSIQSTSNSAPRSDTIHQNTITSVISIGEYVIVSTTRRIAVAAGVVYNVTDSSISLALERNLNKNYSNETFIVDKYDSQSGNSFNFTNLGTLLDNTEASNRLRSYITKHRKPTFSTVLPKKVYTAGADVLLLLNVVQRKTVIKALTSNDYMLIKGLPGTGKTQTLVAIIQLLNMMNKTVIVTSHTNSAVDNILLRLVKNDVNLMRLGSSSRISPKLHEFSEGILTQNCKTSEDYQRVYNAYNIVGVTCFGSAHPIFTHRTFDVCIVDEATQVFQPTILRPLLYAQKFILVGDPQQLPPLVKSKEAKCAGAEESLFHRLDSSDATSVLNLQYRMNKFITKLANEVTYDGELKCANDEVAKTTFFLPARELFLARFKQQRWLLLTLEKHIDFSVVVLNTQNSHQRNIEFTSSDVRNPTEVLQSNGRKSKQNNLCESAIVVVLINAMLSSGYNPDNIGVIAPFISQVNMLRKIFHNIQRNSSPTKTAGNHSSIEINTVDQYQGRDKEVIIYTATKTGTVENKAETASHILDDQRRLTVAFTRSKHKLIVIGDVQCLQTHKPFQTLFAKIPARNKINLEDGSLGFSWSNVFEELRKINA